jgi:hypothetical protein
MEKISERIIVRLNEESVQWRNGVLASTQPMSVDVPVVFGAPNGTVFDVEASAATSGEIPVPC